MRLSGRGVRCVRGGREVFSGLDFEASSGEALAVIGANGSGKTSLLRMIAGLLALAGGSIGLEGGESELTLPEQAHYLGHRDALKPALSVLENLGFWRDFLGGEAFDAGAKALPRSGSIMRLHLPAAYLSAGQRRRLSIARLLAVRRPIWLLDEPTNALDVAGQSLFAGLMARSSRPRRPDRRRHPRAAGDRRARIADRGRRHDRAGRPDPPGHRDRAAGRRRRADRRAVLSHRGGADAVRARTGSRAVDAAGAGDPLARRAAGEPAHPRPAVHWPITTTARST